MIKMDKELGMKVVAKVAVLGLAGLTAFGAAGCNRDGGTNGGTTTIIQQPGGGGANTSSSSSSSAAPVGVAPINDQKELCRQVLQKTRGLSNAVGAFWKIGISRDGWTYTDPDISDAVSRVQKELETVFPALNRIVGKAAPAEIADAANSYLKALDDFSNAITEQQKNEVLNPDASNFGHAKDKLIDVCGAVK